MRSAPAWASALYRRYPSKEELLRKLCSDGLDADIAAVRAALEELDAGADAWDIFAQFMRRVVDAGSTSLTVRLAGAFRPSEQLFRDAAAADELNHQLVARLQDTEALRPDIAVADVGLILELIANVRLGDEQRTAQLRRRYLALLLDGLRPGAGSELPGPPPKPEELATRWQV